MSFRRLSPLIHFLGEAARNGAHLSPRAHQQPARFAIPGQFGVFLHVGELCSWVLICQKVAWISCKRWPCVQLAPPQPAPPQVSLASVFPTGRSQEYDVGFTNPGVTEQPQTALIAAAHMHLCSMGTLATIGCVRGRSIHASAANEQTSISNFFDFIETPLVALSHSWVNVGSTGACVVCIPSDATSTVMHERPDGVISATSCKILTFVATLSTSSSSSSTIPA